jgi:hypothetical protein
MTQIALNEDQVKAVRAAKNAVQITDSSGKLLGYLSRSPSDEEIAEATRRLASAGPWRTTEQVLERLTSQEHG